MKLTFTWKTLLLMNILHVSLVRSLLIRRYDEDVYENIKLYINQCNVLMDVETLTVICTLVKKI